MDRGGRRLNAQRVPARRWRIGLLLGSGVLVNYFDRLNLSVAAPQLQTAFHFGPERIGLILSAFFWSYALCQIPAGMLLDRFGPTRVGRWSALLWGVASALTALAGGLGGLIVARLLLGISEAPSFMVCSKATGYWFPRQERGLATALFDSGAKFSNVIGIPLVALVVVRAGWRWGFGATAALSFCYFAVYCLIYRDPSRDRRLSTVEHDYLVAGGAVREGRASTSALGMLGYLLRQRKVWGLTLGFGAYGYSFYLFLTWLPGYLVQSMHMSILRSASYAAIPWIVATASELFFAGWLIDRMIARGRDESRVRMSVLVGGMSFGLLVFGAMLTLDPHWAIFWISMALGGLSAAASTCWSLPSLVAPAGGVGSVGSLMNLANNLMGAASPFVTGLIVGATGSFSRAFLVAGLVVLAGIVSFVFVLRRIEPIPEPQ
jgi:MFS family permease